MKQRLARLLPALVVGVFAMGACAAEAEPEARRYQSELVALNDSGVQGQVTVDRRGNTVAITINANGLEPERTHPQHLHGFDGEQQGSCPAGQAVGPQELEAAVGPVQMPLEPFPTSREDGGLRFAVTYKAGAEGYAFGIDPAVVERIERGRIVLRGMQIGDQWQPMVPVACGEIAAGGSAGGQEQPGG